MPVRGKEIPEEVLRAVVNPSDRERLLNRKIRRDTKIEFLCPIHNEVFLSSVKAQMKSLGCSKCHYERLSKSTAKTKREKNPVPDWVLLDMVSEDREYFLNGGSKDKKYRFVCKLHGEYYQRIYNHLNGEGCPQCGILSSAKKSQKVRRKRNPIDVTLLKDLADSKDLERILDGTIKMKDKVDFKCDIHGIYSQTLYDHLAGHGCIKCAYKIKPYPNWLLDELVIPEERRGVELGIITGQSVVTFNCKEHGNYKQRLCDHLYGRGCRKCTHWTSNLENELAEFLRSYGLCVDQNRIDLIVNPSTKRGMELDLYLPEHKVAIEVNGLYWHSIEGMEDSKGYGSSISDYKNYHLLKTELCNEKGIVLLHLFEDELKQSRDICVNLILSKCGRLNRERVFGRSAVCKEISKIEAEEFFNFNHIQGFADGKYFGLFSNGRVVSAISVKKAPSNTEDAGSWILNRYASVSDVFVIGGFNKLVSYATKLLVVNRWVSYADRSISKGNLYFLNGWKLVNISPPDYKYIYKGRRYHKFNFRKERFKNDVELKYEEGLTELELAGLNGLRRVYDCGKLKFVKEIG